MDGITDMNELLSESGLGSTLSSMMPLLILVSIATIAITILYGFSMYQRYRTNKATIETRDLLREIRDLIRNQANPLTPPPTVELIPTAPPVAPEATSDKETVSDTSTPPEV